MDLDQDIPAWGTLVSPEGTAACSLPLGEAGGWVGPRDAGLVVFASCDSVSRCGLWTVASGSSVRGASWQQGEEVLENGPLGSESSPKLSLVGRDGFLQSGLCGVAAVEYDFQKHLSEKGQNSSRSGGSSYTF